VHRVTSLVGLGLIMGLVFQRLSGGAPLEARATLALGFLLLAAFVGGLLTRGVNLPRITGYLLIGFLAGPAVLGLVREDEVHELRFLGDAAVALIALAAGGELKLESLKREGRLIGRLTSGAIAAPFALVLVGVLVASPWFPVTAPHGWSDRMVIALMLGVVAAASSPAVAIAVIGETRADGPFARAVLGATVAKDVAVIILFTVALAVARGATSAGAVDVTFVAVAIGELLGWIALGFVLGWLIAQYLKFVRQHLVLFVVAVAFVTAEAAHLMHLETMLVALVAGFFMENISPVEGTALVRGVERSSLPIYAVFFGLAGAGLHLDAFLAVWPWVAGLAFLRIAALIWAARWAAGPGDDAIRRYGWMGFVSQAGVTLGLATVLRRVFPTWGISLEALVVGLIAVHELVGPILFRIALHRAGEVRERERGRAAMPAVAH
jgi:Kef-type K+ transport system membrane component KefB